MTRPGPNWLMLLLLLGGCSHHHASKGAHARAAGKVPAAVASARHRTTVAPASYTKPLIVPHTTGPIHCDGKASETDWHRALRTGPFKDPRTGKVGRPYSEARFLWGAKNLYVLFYAGDDDIHATVTKHDAPLYLEDAFSLKLQPQGGALYDIDFSANGTTSDARELGGGKLDPKWESHAVVGVDRDGTLNNRSDQDEEWLVEARIPLASLGIQGRAGSRFSARIQRCDTPLTGPRGCGVFAPAHEPSGLVSLQLGAR